MDRKKKYAESEKGKTARARAQAKRQAKRKAERKSVAPLSKARALFKGDNSKPELMPTATPFRMPREKRVLAGPPRKAGQFAVSIGSKESKGAQTGKAGYDNVGIIATSLMQRRGADGMLIPDEPLVIPSDLVTKSRNRVLRLSKEERDALSDAFDTASEFEIEQLHEIEEDGQTVYYCKVLSRRLITEQVARGERENEEMEVAMEAWWTPEKQEELKATVKTLFEKLEKKRERDKERQAIIKKLRPVLDVKVEEQNVREKHAKKAKNQARAVPVFTWMQLWTQLGRRSVWLCYLSDEVRK